MLLCFLNFFLYRSDEGLPTLNIVINLSDHHVWMAGVTKTKLCEVYVLVVIRTRLPQWINFNKLRKFKRILLFISGNLITYVFLLTQSFFLSTTFLSSHHSKVQL